MFVSLQVDDVQSLATNQNSVGTFKTSKIINERWHDFSRKYCQSSMFYISSISLNGTLTTTTTTIINKVLLAHV